MHILLRWWKMIILLQRYSASTMCSDLVTFIYFILVGYSAVLNLPNISPVDLGLILALSRIILKLKKFVFCAQFRIVLVNTLRLYLLCSGYIHMECDHLGIMLGTMP